jgi:3-hydroxybutyryl-CoA dehydrogenase
VKAAPGYVVNRLLVPYLLHGIETLESGIADAEGIDEAMKLGCGQPMGPLALSDLIGLDVVYAMADTMKRELGGHRYDMPKSLVQLYEAKQLGRKSGIGIFDYRGDKPVLNPSLKR